MTIDQAKKAREVRYCSKCGVEMLCLIVGAEHFGSNVLHPTKDKEVYESDDAYNPQTGERQYSLWYECPKKRWLYGRSHDAYAHRLGFLDYSQGNKL